MEIIYLLIGLLLGAVIMYFWTKFNNSSQRELDSEKQNVQRLEFSIQSEKEKYDRVESELQTSKEQLDKKENQLREYGIKLASVTTKLEGMEDKFRLQNEAFNLNTDELKDFQEFHKKNEIQKSELKLSKEAAEKEIEVLTKKLEALVNNLDSKTSEFNGLNKLLATEQANNKMLTEKLEVQKEEIKNLGQKFNLEFENIANKILEEKTEKFTNVNQKSLESILKPLGENIERFKKQVEQSYSNEAKERFSLGEQVKEMAKLNKIISDEARNLTTALKGEAKTQGNWGEMILESILEKSGLRKNEEYFIEEQLIDEEGNPLRSDAENKKMRPDAIIKYPDNRSVIIDSKVSLNAFTRYLATSDKTEQDIALQEHVNAVKNHIISLSTKGYDDYDKALDFVLMFVPSEPAYIAAMQGDANLWNYAYDKRILLMNPTNLITALKLISDLWKREYQNKNAIEIASRGAKLYDKFVGFVANLDAVGSHLTKAQEKYADAYKQMSTGNDNLVSQATKLKNLGIKNKKELSKDLKNLTGE